MTFLRSLLFWILFSIALILAGLFVLISIPFTTSDWRYGIASKWCRAIIGMMKTICGVDFSFVNMEEIPKDKPVILLAKHQSAWETLALTGFLPRPLSFVYKKELHRIPIFGQCLASLDMFSLDRSHGRSGFERMKEKAPGFFAKGRVLVLFPEGTRTAPGQVVKYKTGGARLATALNVPVIPVALNSGECWKRNAFCITPGKIQVVFGPEIKPEGMDVHQLNQEVQGWIENEMREISPRFYRN